VYSWWFVGCCFRILGSFVEFCGCLVGIMWVWWFLYIRLLVLVCFLGIWVVFSFAGFCEFGLCRTLGFGVFGCSVF